jgi:O-antigen ligase
MQCLNLMSAWVIYLMLLNSLETREELTRAFTRCLWAAMIAAAIGISAFMLALAGLPVGGAEVSQTAAEHLSMAYGAYGTMVEPNIFGSFTGAFVVLSTGMLALAPRAPAVAARVKLLRATAALSAAGLVLSFTRAAWLGVIVGIVWLVVFGRGTFGIRASRLLKPLFVGIVIVLVLVVLPGTAGEFFRFKLFNIVNLGSSTGQARLFTAVLALQQTVDHPILGNGTFTFAPLVAQGLDFSQFEGWRSLWIGNFVLLALHDTGVIGLALWVALAWSLFARAVRTMRALAPTDPETAARILALTAAVASVLISFLATTGFSLGYPWLLIGLLGAHCRVATSSAAERETRADVASSSPADALLPADAT